MINIKSFCSVNISVKIIKIQLIDWEKKFAKHRPDKELLSKVYKNPLKFNNKKTITPI